MNRHNTTHSHTHSLARGYRTSISCNGGDTQSRNLCKKLVQVDLYKKLDRLTWFLVQYFSCTSFLDRIQHSSIPCKKLACTWLEWWALIGRLPIAAMFSFRCVDVVDNLLYKVNTVCILIYFLNLFKLFK